MLQLIDAENILLVLLKLRLMDFINIEQKVKMSFFQLMILLLQQSYLKMENNVKLKLLLEEKVNLI